MAVSVTLSLLDEQARRDDKRLERSTKEHARLLRESIRDLERRIVEKTRALKESTSGRLAGARTNLRQAQQVHKELTRLFDETYGSAARQVIAGFDEVASWVKENLKDLDVATRWTGVDRDMISALKKTSLEEFKKLGWDAQQKIASALYQHVAAMAPAINLRTTISQALTGRVSKSGRPMESYATQFAVDTTMNFHNAVNMQKADAAGFDHFRYTGSLMLDSRPFCIERVNRIYSRAEIESWTFKWAGKSGPAITHRGGFNCTHHFQAIDPDWLSEEEQARIDTFAEAA